MAPRSIALGVAITAGTVLLLLFLYATRRVLVWALLALILALALDHLVQPLERWVPRTVAVLAVFVAALLALAGIGFALIPPLVDHVTQFAQQLPHIIDQLSHGRGPLGFLEDRFNIVERARRALAQHGAGSLLGFGGPLFTAISSVAQTVIGVVSVCFLTLFMLLRGPAWWAAAIAVVPERQRPLWDRIGDQLHRSIGGWVIGAVIVAVLAGTTATLVLLVLGVPYALALGLIVGLLDPIPFVGATIAAVVAGLVTLASVGLTDAIVFVGFFVVYQQVENHLLVPVVYGRTVQLDALGVLLAVLIGAQLAGILGAIAAIPISGALKAVAGEVIGWRRERRAESQRAAVIRAEPRPPAPSGPMTDRRG